eukprot:superscaffoldBa00001384_g10324
MSCAGSIPQETQQEVYGDIRVNHQSVEDIGPMLQELEQAGLDLNSCEVSEPWKAKVRALVAKYHGLFSRNKLDCGEAKDFVHCIHLKDEWPFCLPYRRVSPADYHKLKVVLDEMEKKGIIRKSCSEWASPLVLVWKKNGDLRVCTDFRKLNQSDALAALGGNVFFSSMDLTSGFYNVPFHEDDKKFTACTTPVGLYEYNRLPQGLCNSPDSFMRLMTSIFGDQNYTSLLCYLDDPLIFAPSEELALERLEMVFSACLSQVAEGEQKARPVAFASKSLNQAQSRYPAHRLEFLALKWAVCHKFSDWLKGKPFTVWTDNNPLTYILTKPKLDASEQRWMCKSAPFDFDIKYVPGVQNVIPDHLSRIPFIKGSITRQIIQEPYQSLVNEAKEVQPDGVQDAFHLTVNTLVLSSEPGTPKAKSDRGSNFESQLIRDLLDIAHIHKSHTTAYHTTGNGSVERFNRTLGSMLRALPPHEKNNWPQMINNLTFS